jgi:uncharacterized membrane protein YdjX (TVP38/TMEM64 family)
MQKRWGKVKLRVNHAIPRANTSSHVPVRTDANQGESAYRGIMGTTTPADTSLQIAHRPLWRRLLAPVVVLLLLGIGYASGLHRYFTFDAIVENRAALSTWTHENFALALIAYVAVYTAAVAVSFPGASILTVISGLLFGWLVGGLAALGGATVGAIIIFQIARSSFGDVLAQRAGPFMAKLADGFSKDAFNYLLFLRLVPLFPFWVINIAPALANVRLRTFATATVLGIIPGTFAFAFVGEGLDSIITTQQKVQTDCIASKGVEACPLELSLSSLVTTEILIAFAALGVVALTPIVIKRLRGAP